MVLESARRGGYQEIEDAQGTKFKILSFISTYLSEYGTKNCMK